MVLITKLLITSIDQIQSIFDVGIFKVFPRSSAFQYVPLHARQLWQRHALLHAPFRQYALRCAPLHAPQRGLHAPPRALLLQHALRCAPLHALQRGLLHALLHALFRQCALLCAPLHALQHFQLLYLKLNFVFFTEKLFITCMPTHAYQVQASLHVIKPNASCSIELCKRY